MGAGVGVALQGRTDVDHRPVAAERHVGTGDEGDAQHLRVSIAIVTKSDDSRVMHPLSVTIVARVAIVGRATLAISVLAESIPSRMYVPLR